MRVCVCSGLPPCIHAGGWAGGRAGGRADACSGAWLGTPRGRWPSRLQLPKEAWSPDRPPSLSVRRSRGGAPRSAAQAVTALASRYPAVKALRDASLEQLENLRSVPGGGAALSDVAYARAKHVSGHNSLFCLGGRPTVGGSACL